MSRHVCIVSNTLADGGAERWASNLCSYLAAQHEHRVSLVLFRHEKTYDCPKSVSIRLLNHQYFLHTFRTIRQLRKILREDTVDVVISNGAFTGQFVGQAVRGTHASWIARISGNIAEGQNGFLQRLGWRWLDRNIATASCIVANSTSLADEVQNRWPKLSDRVTCIPNGVDVERLIAESNDASEDLAESAGSRKIVLGAGRLQSVKRPDLFVRMVVALTQDHDVAAFWCGNGPLRGEIERQVTEHLLGDRLKFLGFRKDLPALMKCAACFVLTSDHEGSPNVLAEAMAIGIPIVSTDCPHGPRELLGDDRGWLVPVGDVGGLTRAVIQILSEPEEAKRRAALAQAWAREHLSLDVIGQRWNEWIEQTSSRNMIPNVQSTRSFS